MAGSVIRDPSSALAMFQKIKSVEDERKILEMYLRRSYRPAVQHGVQDSDYIKVVV